MEFFEISGPAGYELIDGHGQYTYARSQSYCGLLMGVVSAGQNEWRILDMRQAQNMNTYYALQYNPLIMASRHAHNELSGELSQRSKP